MSACTQLLACVLNHKNVGKIFFAKIYRAENRVTAPVLNYFQFSEIGGHFGIGKGFFSEGSNLIKSAKCVI